MLGEPQEEYISKEEVLEMIEVRPERCWRNFVMNYRIEASATFKRNIRNLGKRYASIVVD